MRDLKERIKDKSKLPRNLLFDNNFIKLQREMEDNRNL